MSETSGSHLSDPWTPASVPLVLRQSGFGHEEKGTETEPVMEFYNQQVMINVSTTCADRPVLSKIMKPFEYGKEKLIVYTGICLVNRNTTI